MATILFVARVSGAAGERQVVSHHNHSSCRSYRSRSRNQLLIPFGGPKWSIERIGVVGVSTTGTYIESDTPLAYINNAERRGLRLRHFTSVVPGDWPEISAAGLIRDYLRDKSELATEHERKFIHIYFEYCIEETTPPQFLLQRAPKDRHPPYDDNEWLFDALLPLPQAHHYQANPLEDHFSFDG